MPVNPSIPPATIRIPCCVQAVVLCLSAAEPPATVGVRLLRSAADYAASPAPEPAHQPYCVGVKLAADGYSLSGPRPFKCGGGRPGTGPGRSVTDLSVRRRIPLIQSHRDLDTARVFAKCGFCLAAVYTATSSPLARFSENRILPDVVIACSERRSRACA